MSKIHILQSSPILRISLGGEWRYTTSKKDLRKLYTLIHNAKEIEIDFIQQPEVDFAFCALLLSYLKNKSYTFTNQNYHTQEIFTTLLAHPTHLLKDSRSSSPIHSLLSSIGAWVLDFFQSMLDFFHFFGMTLYYLYLSIIHPRRFKIASIFYHISESGLKSLPVVLTTSFIVSYAIALQGVIQLDKMGVPIMSVEIVAKLCLRELGPFVLALVIAGRSASSFSAQIGVMNLTEENDALKTMGFSVIDFLVTPRILALILTMPLLVFLADVVSLLAGMLAINVQAGISFTQYWERFYEYVNISHFWVGIVKAPFFGIAIGLVGCFRGLKVQGDTESLGKQTTLSVVNAIFWIIVINAIFSFFTTSLGI